MNDESISLSKRWSQFVAGFIVAISHAKSIDWSDQDLIDSILLDSERWSKSDLGFDSSLRSQKYSNGDIRLSSEDGKTMFNLIAEDGAEALMIGLAATADAICQSIYKDIEGEHTDTLSSTTAYVQYYQKRLKGVTQHTWCIKGMFELIAIRNTLLHSNGYWCEKSIGILELGEVDTSSIDCSRRIRVSFDDIYKYRRALRTFAGELKRLSVPR
ncbi:MAG: hypothetical protein Q7P63_01165 [Verrucomicrobiota bacterium JB022]|nr:hypothetical protein [Verrucomicrobiota bacterium JB022]